ncbi:hypothetical protein BV898_18537 [Hypsibius exemplaris]|uniref:Transmembrane protein n=1 Tax=Hypsibius exemplaris TaxID=2072580 RepID=A0A9X6NJ01_HYPEX|nr:hypothetical protein BV898_18537 [Hypsibius exemplaris]
MAAEFGRRIRSSILESRLLTQLFLPHELHPRPSIELSETETRAASRFRLIINFLMAVAFAGCTIVQFNDPDPALWVPVYCVPALACLVDIFSQYIFELLMGSILALLHLAYCLGMALSTLTFFCIKYEDMDYDHFNESMRSRCVKMSRGRKFENGKAEFCGLLMVLLWNIHIFVALRRNLTSQQKVKASVAYLAINVTFLVSAWICFPHMAEDSPFNHAGVKAASSNTSGGFITREVTSNLTRLRTVG